MMTQPDNNAAKTRTADLPMALCVPLPSMHLTIALCVPDGLQADVPGHACINTSSQTHAHVSYLMGCQREHEPAESAGDCWYAQVVLVCPGIVSMP